jgi:hypothetical protein
MRRGGRRWNSLAVKSICTVLCLETKSLPKHHPTQSVPPAYVSEKGKLSIRELRAS